MVNGPQGPVLSSRRELPLGPDCFGHRHQFVVHIDGIDALIIQAQEMGDGRIFRQRFLIAPHDVLEDHFTNADRLIGCHTLIGATGSGFCRLQTLHQDILLRNVIAGRQPRLKQEQRMVGLGYGHTTEQDAHMP
jgi:hypothetical protein